MAGSNGYEAPNLVMGPARLYIYLGTFDPTLSYEPALTAVNTTPPPSAWYDAGITLGGANLGNELTWTALTGDQIVDELGARMTGRKIKVTINFAEITLQSLKYAWNMTDGPSGTGYKSAELISTQAAARAPYRTIMIDGVGPDTAAGVSQKRRAILRKSLPGGNTALNWEKANQQVLAAEFTGYWVSETVSPLRVIDEIAP